LLTISVARGRARRDVLVLDDRCRSRLRLRLGELRALEWRHIDFANGTRRVEQSIGKKKDPANPGRVIEFLGPTKNGRPRAVPMSVHVVEALRRHPRRLNSPWVWPSEDGDFLKENEAKHPMRRALKRAHLPNDQWHICRHSFCSHLVQRGVHLLVVKELAGHTHLKSTLRYAHLDPMGGKAAVALLDSAPAQPAKRSRNAG